MVRLGLEHWAAGWKAQTNTLSYGGTPTKHKIFHLGYNLDWIQSHTTYLMNGTQLQSLNNKRS